MRFRSSSASRCARRPLLPGCLSSRPLGPPPASRARPAAPPHARRPDPPSRSLAPPHARTQVCDVLVAILEPRDDRVGTPIDPDMSHTIVQLAFGQIAPNSAVLQHIHTALGVQLHQHTVISWSRVISHLARSRFDQIVQEFTSRLGPVKNADDAFHILVGVQRVTIPSILAPACLPFLDQFRQVLLSDKKHYRDPLIRLCTLHSLELTLRQVDCGAADLAPEYAEQIYTKLYAMYVPLQEWAEKAELMVAATQLLALIVCHAPVHFWQAHMDVSKEGKKAGKKGHSTLLGKQKEGLLRHLLTGPAYEDKSNRAALLGVLRLLTGGQPLPTALLGRPSDAEWWTAFEAAPKAEGSLMNHTMRTFQEDAPDPAAEGGEGGEGAPNPLQAFLGGLGGAGGGMMMMETPDDENTERLRFVVEKLFARKTSGRTVRLPRLLESGDVLVYILGQIAAHSLRVGEDAIELLLRDARDIEYSLLGICALGRVLRSPVLSSALAGKLGWYAERLEEVLARCEDSVGARVLGLSPRTLPVAPPGEDDSVQVLLTSVTRKRDREIAVRVATYREALGCIPLATPASCLQPHRFVGELLLHSDEELALMASRVVQRFAREQPPRRKELLRCYGKMLVRLLSEPGGSMQALKSRDHHAEALQGMEANLLTVVDHLNALLDVWSAALPHEPWELDDHEIEVGQGSEVVRLETELVEVEAAAIVMLAHPSRALRIAALALTEKVRGLFDARKAAYYRAITERLSVLTSSTLASARPRRPRRRRPSCGGASTASSASRASRRTCSGGTRPASSARRSSASSSNRRRASSRSCRRRRSSTRCKCRPLRRWSSGRPSPSRCRRSTASSSPSSAPPS